MALHHGSSPPIFRGILTKLAANQTTADYSAAATIPFDTEVYDTLGATLSAGVVTIPAGISWVLPVAYVNIGSVTASVLCTLELYQDDAQITPRHTANIHTANTSPSIGLVPVPLAVTAGQTLRLKLTIPADTSITVFAASSAFGFRVLQ